MADVLNPVSFNKICSAWYGENEKSVVLPSDEQGYNDCMSWQLSVLGAVSLSTTEITLHPERKTVALLTYLALEGPTPRSKLAGLLWPDSGESKARSNLRQLLSRLKKSIGAELVIPEEILRLQGLEVDAARLKVLAFSSSDEILQLSGELLSPYDYDDCPDFADWLLSERERIETLRQNALAAKIKTLEQSANYSEALRYAETLLTLESLSEEAYRQVMRLHYLCGDRAAALTAFERCKSILEKELGVEPLPETLGLVSEIEWGSLLPTALPHKQKAELPLRVLRPPLVGREEAWQRMTEAWQQHQAIFISGVPGVGKSRLMQEFVRASSKPHCLFEARLGDASVPYATNTRNFRKMLADFPVTLGLTLKRELARILSELGEAPAPISSESELVRFYDAQEKPVRLAMEAGLAALAYDDVQYVDAASLQGWLHSSANHLGKDDGLRLIASFRKGELSPETQKSLDQLVSSGLAVLIELEELPEQEVSKLIDNLGIADLQPLTEQLSRYTGGNPLFIVEAIKHLIESEQLGSAKVALPTTGKVFALLKERLSRLSTQAQRLVWTAAVAQADFSLELASSILATSPFDLAEPFEELSATNIFSGLRFSHDLLFETALTTIPAPIKVYLHRRCAEELEKNSGSPGVIAEHWMNAGDEEKAVPKLLEAARQQQANFRYVEAVQIFDKAIALLEKLGNKWDLFGVICEQGSLISGVPDGMKRMEQFVEKLFALAHTPEQKAKACEYALGFYMNKGDVDKLESISKQGYEHALEVNNLSLQISFLNGIGVVFWMRGFSKQGIDKLKEALHIAKTTHNEKEIANISNGIGMMLGDFGNYEEAEVYLQEAERIFATMNSKLDMVGVKRNRAFNKACMGYIRAALELSHEALDLLNQTSGSLEMRLLTEVNCARYLMWLDEYEQAFKVMKNLEESVLEDYFLSFLIDRHLGVLFLQLGQFKMSHFHFQRMRTSKHVPAFRVAAELDYIMLLIVTHSYNGELSRLENSSGDAVDEINKLCLKARLTKNSAIAKQAWSSASKLQLKGYEISSLLVCALTTLNDHPREALKYTTHMLKLLEACDARTYRGEIFLTHYQALKACKIKSARDYLEKTLAWLMNVADTKVPSEYRESFLNNNPTNKAILEAAKEKGLLGLNTLTS